MRIIASIVVNDEAAYRTQNFKEITYLGDPINIAKLLEAMKYDEICFINVNRGIFNTKSEIDTNFISLIKRVCRNVRIPISVIVDVESDLYVQMLFDQGIDRIYCELSMEKQKLMFNWSEQFGRQSIGLTQGYDKLINLKDVEIDTSYFCELRVYNKHSDNIYDIKRNFARYSKISKDFQLPLVIANGISRNNLEQYINLSYVVGLNVSSMTNSIGKNAAPFIVANPLRICR